MDKGVIGVRITALHIALEIAKEDKSLVTASTQGVLESAKEIEKYILDNEPKAEQK